MNIDEMRWRDYERWRRMRNDHGAWEMRCPIAISEHDLGGRFPEGISIRLGMGGGLIKISINLGDEFDADINMESGNIQYRPNLEQERFIESFLNMFVHEALMFDNDDRIRYVLSDLSMPNHGEGLTIYSVYTPPIGHYEIDCLCRPELVFLCSPIVEPLPVFLRDLDAEHADTTHIEDGITLSAVRAMRGVASAEEAGRHYVEYDRTQIPFITQQAPTSTPMDSYSTSIDASTIYGQYHTEYISRTISDALRKLHGSTVMDAAGVLTYAAGYAEGFLGSKKPELPDGMSDELNDFLAVFQRKETNEMILRSAT